MSDIPPQACCECGNDILDSDVCIDCLRDVQLKLSQAEAQLTALRARIEEVLSLAAFATNGWACYARTNKEHDEIARLHAERNRLSALLRETPEKTNV